MALALGYMGALGQALNHIETSLELARQLRHPYSLTLALITAGIYALHLRDVERAAIYMEELFTLYTKQDEHYLAMHARIFQGWLETVREDVAAGILKMQESLEATAAMGGQLWQPFYRAILAEVYHRMGRDDAGMACLDPAWAVLDLAGDSVDAAELYRMRGECLLGMPAPEPSLAEASFQQALEIARAQEAKLLELRAAMSLGRLWQQQGRRDTARALLERVYRRFTEGLDTPLLQEARSMLDGL